MEVKSTQNFPPAEDINQVAKSSGATHVNVVRHQYTWTITNFSYSQNQTGQSLLSPRFTVGTKIKTQWQLQAFLNAQSITKNNYLGLYLNFVPGIVAEAKASCKLCIINDKKKETNVFSFKNVTQFGIYDRSYGWPNFATKNFLLDPINGCLPNDSLTIFCDLTVVDSIANTTIEGALENFKLPQPRLLADLVELYESPKLSDVTIVTRGKEFSAHKAILAARSPYFSTILEQRDIMEQQNNRVYVMDVLDEVMKEILRFIYTDVALNVDKMADNLLVAADKYQLNRLKSLCEKSLVDNIDVENSANRLVIGELYGAAHLKKNALQFICTHAKEVMVTESYKSLHHTHPNLIDEAFQKLTATNVGLTASTGGATTCLKQRGRKRKVAAYRTRV